MSDPEKIIHKRVWKERKLARAENPEYSIEDYLPSSSQEISVENPDSTGLYLLNLFAVPTLLGRNNSLDLENHCGGQ